MQEITPATPDEVMRRVAAVISADAGKQLFTVICLVVVMDILEEDDVRMAGDEDVALAKLEVEFDPPISQISQSGLWPLDLYYRLKRML
jgi:hypothetical protein